MYSYVFRMRRTRLISTDRPRSPVARRRASAAGRLYELLVERDSIPFYVLGYIGR